MAIEITTEMVDVCAVPVLANMADGSIEWAQRYIRENKSALRMGDCPDWTNQGPVTCDRCCVDEALCVSRTALAAVAPLIEAQISADNERLTKEHDAWRDAAIEQQRLHKLAVADLAQARAAAIEEAARVALSYGTDLRNHDAVRTAGAAIAAALRALASRPVREREGAAAPQSPEDDLPRGELSEEEWADERKRVAALATPPGYEPYTPATVQAISAVSQFIASQKDIDPEIAAAMPSLSQMLEATAPAISGGEIKRALDTMPKSGEFYAPNKDGDLIRVRRFDNPFGYEDTVINPRTGKWWTPLYWVPIAALAAADRRPTPPASGKTQDEVFRAEGEEA